MSIDEGVRPGARIQEAGDAYMPGFANHHATEAVAGALPIGRNSPQRPPYGLYAEQLSGTAFTAPSSENRRSWLYRIRPSVQHLTRLVPAPQLNPHWRTAPLPAEDTPAAQLRWPPLALPDGPTDFVEGLRTMTACGDAGAQDGMAAHVFAANRSMRRVLVNGDAEMVILPERGRLRVVTELGVLTAGAGEIVCVPRGCKFRVELPDGDGDGDGDGHEETVRGYALENYGPLLRLPERGPIGANGLASERDFLTPVAAYEEGGPCEIVLRWQGGLHRGELDHSPFDVAAWHGTLAPYKYDLRRFNTIGSISYDHPDPSIFTVLTSPSAHPGTANLDLVCFPDRWLVMEDTFRPPWYHTNVMSEFMGLLYGEYDAKPGGFVPGGMSLHNAILPHGPDAEAHAKASGQDLAPQKLSGTMAFMFETRLVQRLTPFAAKDAARDDAYPDCWAGLPPARLPD